MLRCLRIGAYQQLAVISHMGRRRPDLLAGDDVVITIAHGTGSQAGQIRPRFGLGESLAPHMVTAQDRRKVEGPLLDCSLGDERRTGMERPYEVAADVRCTSPFELLEEHEFLGW